MNLKRDRKALGVGHTGTREIRDYDLPKVQLCKYSPDCQRACEENERCQVYKFYERYPSYLEGDIGVRI